MLDVGCGEGKDKGYIGMDRRDVKGVDIVWDIESVAPVPFWARNLGIKSEPWPIPTESVDRLICAHLLEHIAPSAAIAVMDEMWRVLKYDGQAMVVVPHADSFGMKQDPTHIAFWNEATFSYFDPGKGGLYLIYKPKPWLVRNMTWSPYSNLQVILEPRKKPDGTPVDITVIDDKKEKKKQKKQQHTRTRARSKR